MESRGRLETTRRPQGPSSKNERIKCAGTISCPRSTTAIYYYY
jgi:hypothetical protein